MSSRRTRGGQRGFGTVLPIALGVDFRTEPAENAEDEQAIVDKELEITSLTADLAESTVTFLTSEQFTNEKELAQLAADWPGSRLVDIWNRIPGWTPVKRFTNRAVATARIWRAVQSLVSGEHSGDVAPARRHAARKPTRQQHAHTGRKHTKQSQVVALLKRSGGATLQHLMRATGWQAHSVRGFISGALGKRLGLKIESFKNSRGERFMFRYIPEMFRAETADTEEEADRWYTDKQHARRTPDLLPRDEVARAINSEIKEGRGSPHGGVYLDIASRRSADDIKRRLPSMYHQFLQLADVDITKEPMEVGPTCHYMMGGVRVDAETQASTVPGLFAAGECAAGLHGANRLGGNSLSDLVVFGRRAGMYAARYAAGLAERPRPDPREFEEIARRALQPFDATGAENPYAVQQDLQACMQILVGIIRTEDELEKALQELAVLETRAGRVRVEGHRQYNPGWNLALDLRAMLAVSKCITLAARERRESRGAQTRDDYPTPDAELGKVNVVVRQTDDGELSVAVEALPRMPDDLRQLLEDT